MAVRRVHTMFASKQNRSEAPTLDPSEIKPLSPWFFALEGLIGAAYDIAKMNPDAWMALVALAAVNIAVSATMLGRRRKLLRAMLKDGRSRKILVGLIALRVGAHIALGALGTQVEGTAGHLAMAVGMTATTVALLWYDQRVTFRALGLTPTPRLRQA